VSDLTTIKTHSLPLRQNRKPFTPTLFWRDKSESELEQELELELESPQSDTAVSDSPF
jgi:hypothetical protein